MDQDVITELNLVFGKTDKEYLTADVYRPVVGEKLPAVILIHGGGFQAGSKEMYSEWGPYLAEAGFVAIAINYRLTSTNYSTWPGVLEDVQAAVNWLVSKSNEWHVDPQRIGLIGDSAGAHLATHFPLVNPSNASFKILAAIGVYGSYDVEEKWKTSPEMKKSTEKLIGYPFPDAMEKYKEASAINHIERAVSTPTFDTSFFIIWGEEDKITPPYQSENFVNRLIEAGVETKKLVIPDKGHLWFNLLPGVKSGSLSDYPNNEVAPQIVDFLKSKLCTSEVGNFSKSYIKRLKTLL